MSDLEAAMQNLAASDEPAQNYSHTPFGVEVSFPETVTIRMVDASALGDYEFGIVVSGFCCNAAVGLLVAAITVSGRAVSLGIMSALFWVLTILFLIWSLVKRAAIKTKERVVKLRGGDAKAILETSA